MNLYKVQYVNRVGPLEILEAALLRAPYFLAAVAPFNPYSLVKVSKWRDGLQMWEQLWTPSDLLASIEDEYDA